MSEAPTRGEFELLKSMVAASQARLEGIDSAGTKGVAVVQQQLTDLAKDVVRLEVEVDKRFDEHLHVHQQDQRERTAGRRWLIGTLIAAVVMLVAILGLAINIASKGRM